LVKTILVLSLLFHDFLGGAHIHDDKLTVTVPTEMWVEALDMGLARLTEKKFDFQSVVAVSGTGQVCFYSNYAASL